MTPSSWVEWVNRPEQNLKLVDRAANSRCNCVAMQGEVAAIGFEDSTIQIITIENLKVRQELNQHDDGVTAIAWARFLLASGDRTGRILMWNSVNFALLYSLDGHQVGGWWASKGTPHGAHAHAHKPHEPRAIDDLPLTIACWLLVI